MAINPKLIKRKKQIAKKQLEEQIFVRTYNTLYHKYTNIGFSHERAIKCVKQELAKRETKKGEKALEILKDRYQSNVNKPNIESISLEGIRRTQAVKNWIKNMENKELVIDMGYKLILKGDESVTQ